MGEEGILMCFAFFSDTKVGMHRTSGSFTSQIAMRYQTSRTLISGKNQGILQKHVMEISGNFQLYIYI